MPPNKGNLTMAFLSVTAPKSTLSLYGLSGDTAIAYGDGDTIDSGQFNAQFDTTKPGNNNTVISSGKTRHSSTETHLTAAAATALPSMATTTWPRSAAAP